MLETNLFVEDPTEYLPRTLLLPFRVQDAGCMRTQLLHVSKHVCAYVFMCAHVCSCAHLHTNVFIHVHD